MARSVTDPVHVETDLARLRRRILNCVGDRHRGTRPSGGRRSADAPCSTEGTAGIVACASDFCETKVFGSGYCVDCERELTAAVPRAAPARGPVRLLRTLVAGLRKKRLVTNSVQWNG